MLPIKDQIGSDPGAPTFVVAWHEVTLSSVKFRVAEVQSSYEGRRIRYVEEDPETLGGTGGFDEAAEYMSGYIREDGCSHIYAKHMHICGNYAWREHLKLLTHLYHRAFELMDKPLSRPWGCPA